MAVSNEQFLFCCIEHSTAGTVNWQKVAEICGIPSKGAAAVKYRRLKDKFGTVSSASATAGSEDGSPAPAEEKKAAKKGKKAPAKKTAHKKRKHNDEDDEKANVKAEDADESP